MSAPTRAATPWTMPTGRLVLSADAPRGQWLEARRQGIGSSDIAQLMGVAEGGTEYELWLDKMGRGDAPQTEAMRRGTWLEPHVAAHFGQATNLRIRRCGLLSHRDEPTLLATPDRLVEDGGLLEIKTIGPWAKVGAEWRHGGIARHAYCQVQWQLMVSGRAHGWLAAYTIDQEPQIRGPVERDEPLIQRMRAKALVWWADHVVTRIPPPPDLATITDEEIALRWPNAQPGSTQQAEWPHHVRALLSERAELKAAAKTATDRAKEIDAALKVMVGEAEALLVGDRPVITLKKQLNNPSVDAALETDYPEIYSRYIKRGSSRRIHVVKGWEQA